MRLYPSTNAAKHPVGSIISGQGNPGQGWVLCDGSSYLKSSYAEYVSKSIDLHPLRFQKHEMIYFTNTPAAEIKSVAINGDTIVMVGATTRYHWRSTDGGDNWTEYSVNLPSSQDWRLVRYANSQYVAVGYNSTAVAYSSDGITWNSVTLSASGLWEYLYWDGTQWILAPANGGTYYTSDDSIIWTQRTGMPSPDISGIAVDLNNNELMIISEATNPYCYHSTDGITWTNKEYFEHHLRSYDGTFYAANVMYFPDSDKWCFVLDDAYNGPVNQAFESYDDGDNWTIINMGTRWPESAQYFGNGTLWDGDCHIWFEGGTYFRGYYMKDSNAWVNFSGPGYGLTPESPMGFASEYERCMIVPSFESGEANFDYIYKYHYGDYNPQTYFCVPNLTTRHYTGIDSYIRIE